MQVQKSNKKSANANLKKALKKFACCNWHFELRAWLHDIYCHDIKHVGNQHSYIEQLNRSIRHQNKKVTILSATDCQTLSK